MEGLWIGLDQETRNNIKEAILGCLIDPNPQIWRGTASCIAAIAKIELPLNQWNELIETLSRESSHENLAFWKAAL